MSCIKTNSGQRITDGTIVIVLRYPGVKWIVHHGWYTYRNQQFNGWYLVSIPANMTMPLNEEDLELLTIVSGGDIQPPPPSVDVPHMPPGYAYPEVQVEPPKPPKDHHPKDHKDEHEHHDDHEHNSDYDNEEYSKGDNDMAENTCNKKPENKPDNYFVTVRNVEERNRLSREGVPQGKVVKVNYVKGETKYYTYDQISESWVEETFGLGAKIDKQAKAISDLKSVISDINTAVGTLTDTVATLVTASGESAEAITELQETITDLQEKIESIETSEVTWVDANGEEID